MKKLNRKTTSLPQNRPVKVLQFGSGNFLRAFADWMIDILNEKTDFNGAIQIIQSVSSGSNSAINEQDGLYHVVVSGIQNGKPFNETRLITSVVGTINPQEQPDAYSSLAENVDLKFVISNTTEAGINFNQEDELSSMPLTFPGKLTLLLYKRFQFFKGNIDKGIIVLPCELIERNGEILKSIVIQYANHWNLSYDFIEWVNHHNTFYNTLVDRIVPGFPKQTINEIEQSIGYDDKLVVMAEPYYLWVIEAPESLKNDFPVDKAGLSVKFTGDLIPYRTSKVRILNGAHTTLVPVAYLKGFRTVRESIEDNETGNFLRDAIFHEIIPTLNQPADELNQFANDVLERFLNPNIKHELISISLNSISKFKVRVLPSILRYIEIKKEMPDRLLFSLAALIRFYKGSWKSKAISLNDTAEVLMFFKEKWATSSIEELVQQTLSNKSFWGQDLNEIDGLANAVTQHLITICSTENNP